MATFFLIAALFACFFWIIGLLLLWRIPYCKLLDKTNTLPSCSLIIPARNEESNIAQLLESLHNQKDRLTEIIVVDDQSSDETSQVAKGYGAKVLGVVDKPEGWTGKTWACWLGAQEAQGELLLFVDADTTFDTRGIEKILHTYMANPGMVTVQPYHAMKKGYESLSLFFNIMIMAGIGAFTIFGKRVRPSGSFGPCMLCSKKDYFDLGGHEAVKQKVLENLALGNLFLHAQKSVYCYGGKGTISFRMYPNGLKDLIEGWTKGFATGASITRPLYLVATSLWMTGTFITFFGALLSFSIPALREGFSTVYAFLYGGFFFQILILCRRIGNFNLLGMLLYPVMALFFVFVFIRSYISIFIIKRVTWRGRSVKVS